MKVLGKMCLIIILKVTKNQGFTLSLKTTRRGDQFDPPSRFRVNTDPNRYINLTALDAFKQQIKMWKLTTCTC